MATKPIPLFNEALGLAVKYGALPMSHFTVPYFPVKALTSTGGLTKGNVYFVYLITDQGQCMVHGMTERTYPMRCFSRPKPSTENVKAVADLMATFRPTDLDQGKLDDE